MGAEVPIGIRVAIRPRAQHAPQAFANAALRVTTRFWFVVTIASQLLFAVAVASFYGRAAVSGNVEMLNRFMRHGHIAGDTIGNTAVAMHLASAVVIILAGALQLVPGVRKRSPRLHRWSGRLYVLTALTLSVAGVYMHWARPPIVDATQRWAGTLNAVLIWTFAAIALRTAMKRDFGAHRRWALRLFFAVSASWIFRIVFFLWMVIFQRPVGFDPNTFQGPFLTIAAFAVYFVPLAILELWLRAQSGGTMRRLAVSTVLVLCALGTAVGTFAVSAAVWVPSLESAYDPRKPVATMLASAIALDGVERAVQQYQALKAKDRGAWNFDEAQLNTLGYQLLHDGKVDEAIAVFRLNTAAYPRSSNTWDSLGEAWLKKGNAAEAMASYRKALALDPKNMTSAGALQKLTATAGRAP